MESVEHPRPVRSEAAEEGWVESVRQTFQRLFAELGTSRHVEESTRRFFSHIVSDRNDSNPSGGQNRLLSDTSEGFPNALSVLGATDLSRVPIFFSGRFAHAHVDWSYPKGSVSVNRGDSRGSTKSVLSSKSEGRKTPLSHDDDQESSAQSSVKISEHCAVVVGKLCFGGKSTASTNDDLYLLDSLKRVKVVLSTSPNPSQVLNSFVVVDRWNWIPGSGGHQGVLEVEHVKVLIEESEIAYMNARSTKEILRWRSKFCQFPDPLDILDLEKGLEAAGMDSRPPKEVERERICPEDDLPRSLTRKNTQNKGGRDRETKPDSEKDSQIVNLFQGRKQIVAIEGIISAISPLVRSADDDASFFLLELTNVPNSREKENEETSVTKKMNEAQRSQSMSGSGYSNSTRTLEASISHQQGRYATFKHLGKRGRKALGLDLPGTANQSKSADRGASSDGEVRSIHVLFLGATSLRWHFLISTGQKVVLTGVRYKQLKKSGRSLLMTTRHSRVHDAELYRSQKQKAETEKSQPAKTTRDQPESAQSSATVGKSYSRESNELSSLPKTSQELGGPSKRRVSGGRGRKRARTQHTPISVFLAPKTKKVSRDDFSSETETVETVEERRRCSLLPGELVSYSGEITGIICEDVFELDRRKEFHLFLTHFPHATRYAGLRVGAKIRVENVHVIMLPTFETIQGTSLSDTRIHSVRGLAACSRTSIHIEQFSPFQNSTVRQRQKDPPNFAISKLSVPELVYCFDLKLSLRKKFGNLGEISKEYVDMSQDLSTLDGAHPRATTDAAAPMTREEEDGPTPSSIFVNRNKRNACQKVSVPLSKKPSGTSVMVTVARAIGVSFDRDRRDFLKEFCDHDDAECAVADSRHAHTLPEVWTMSEFNAYIQGLTEQPHHLPEGSIFRRSTKLEILSLPERHRLSESPKRVAAVQSNKVTATQADRDGANCVNRSLELASDTCGGRSCHEDFAADTPRGFDEVWLKGSSADGAGCDKKRGSRNVALIGKLVLESSTNRLFLEDQTGYIELSVDRQGCDRLRHQSLKYDAYWLIRGDSFLIEEFSGDKVRRLLEVDLGQSRCLFVHTKAIVWASQSREYRAEPISVAPCLPPIPSNSNACCSPPTSLPYPWSLRAQIDTKAHAVFPFCITRSRLMGFSGWLLELGHTARQARHAKCMERDTNRETDLEAASEAFTETGFRHQELVCEHKSISTGGDAELPMLVYVTSVHAGGQQNMTLSTRNGPQKRRSTIVEGFALPFCTCNSIQEDRGLDSVFQTAPSSQSRRITKGNPGGKSLSGSSINLCEGCTARKFTFVSFKFPNSSTNEDERVKLSKMKNDSDDQAARWGGIARGTVILIYGLGGGNESRYSPFCSSSPFMRFLKSQRELVRSINERDSQAVRRTHRQCFQEGSSTQSGQREVCRHLYYKVPPSVWLEEVELHLVEIPEPWLEAVCYQREKCAPSLLEAHVPVCGVRENLGKADVEASAQPIEVPSELFALPSKQFGNDADNIRCLRLTLPWFLYYACMLECYLRSAYAKTTSLLRLSQRKESSLDVAHTEGIVRQVWFVGDASKCVLLVEIACEEAGKIIGAPHEHLSDLKNHGASSLSGSSPPVTNHLDDTALLLLESSELCSAGVRSLSMGSRLCLSHVSVHSTSDRSTRRRLEKVLRRQPPAIIAAIMERFAWLLCQTPLTAVHYASSSSCSSSSSSSFLSFPSSFSSSSPSSSPSSSSCLSSTLVGSQGGAAPSSEKKVHVSSPHLYSADSPAICSSALSAPQQPSSAMNNGHESEDATSAPVTQANKRRRDILILPASELVAASCPLPSSPNTARTGGFQREFTYFANRREHWGAPVVHIGQLYQPQLSSVFGVPILPSSLINLSRVKLEFTVVFVERLATKIQCRDCCQIIGREAQTLVYPTDPESAVRQSSSLALNFISLSNGTVSPEAAFKRPLPSVRYQCPSLICKRQRLRVLWDATCVIDDGTGLAEARMNGQAVMDLLQLSDSEQKTLEALTLAHGGFVYSDNTPATVESKNRSTGFSAAPSLASLACLQQKNDLWNGGDNKLAPWMSGQPSVGVQSPADGLSTAPSLSDQQASRFFREIVKERGLQYRRFSALCVPSNKKRSFLSDVDWSSVAGGRSVQEDIEKSNGMKTFSSPRQIVQIVRLRRRPVDRPRLMELLEACSRHRGR